jgi:phage major head subunit gpT-like protein
MLKKQKREALKGTTHTRSVGVRVSRLDDDNSTNTLSFVFISDDNGGERFDWGSGEYYTEVLDINGARNDRLNTFFKDHIRSVDSAIGKISNVKIEDNMLIGDVTFGSDEDSQRIYSKYREGILTDVSIGYIINKYDVTRGAENEQDTVTVTNFDIFEVSAVGIGFDSGAKKRENEIEIGSFKMNEEQLRRLEELEALAKRNAEEKRELADLKAKREIEEAKEEAKRAKLELAEVKRKSECEEIAKEHGEIGQRALADNADATADQLRKAILAEIAKGQNVVPQDDTSVSARDKMIDAMIDGLALRVGTKLDKTAEGAEKYRHASLLSLANELLPESERSYNPDEVATRSMVTGQFPLLLQSVGARVMTAEFEARLGTFKRWIKEVDVPDFRLMTDLTSAVGGGRLDETLENGDLKELGAVEKAETWKISTFGNKFVVTREMIINDDLGAFTTLMGNFGRMAMTTANGIAYDLLQGKGKYANYVMADGLGVFDPARENTALDALSSEALSAGRLAMSKHKSIDGVTPLNITPKYLIVPPALEVTAREILNATSKVGADNVNVPNVNQNLYELVIDPEITSDTAWYLMADYRTLKMGYLAGTNRSPVTKMNDSTVSRTVFEGVFDIGVMAEDYRGLYRGNV